MLRKFLYLNTAELDSYLSMLEDGLVQETTRTETTEKEYTAGADIKIASGQRAGSTGGGSERRMADTREARFDRFHKAVNANPDETGWVEVLEADAEFERCSIGEILHWEADVYVPDFLKIMSKGGEGSAALDMMSGIAGLAGLLGESLEGLPTQSEIDGMKGMMDHLDTKLVAVGEDDETAWQVAGVLQPEGILDDEIDGRAIIVGKVKNKVKANQWYPLMSLPGMGLGRNERRKLANEPAEGEEDNYLRGPIVLIDVLAIFR